MISTGQIIYQNLTIVIDGVQAMNNNLGIGNLMLFQHNSKNTTINSILALNNTGNLLTTSAVDQQHTNNPLIVAI